jgi:hypothetical protein
MGHIEITTIIPCTNACRFCPQEVLVSAYDKKEIKELTFYEFAGLLEKIPKTYGIHFSGFSEPFLNSKSSKMIAYAYELGYHVSIFSTLVGLTAEDVDIMKDVRFNGITLHVPDDWNFITDTAEWINNYKLFTSYFNVDSANYYIGDVDPHVASCNVHKASAQCLNSRCNNVNPFVVPHVKRIKGKILCVGGGRCPVLLPNGDTVICCMDWGLKHKTGNLYKDSFEDLFRNEFNKIKESWDDEKIETICRYCQR